jgi:hypothetical protein
MESLDRAGMHPDNQDPTKQFAIISARELLVSAGVKDPGPKLETDITIPEAPQLDKKEPQDTIARTITEYKKGPLTPELVNTTWQTLWGEWGKRIEETFDVPSCDRTSEELAKLQKENKAALLIPDNVDLVMLEKMFPQMRSWAVSEGATVTESSRGGSIDIEMDVDSLHRDTTEAQVNDFLESQERDGQRLKTYIIGSQLSKLLTGRYFDENSWSRLPGSRYEGGMVGARFISVGYLDVVSGLVPQGRHPGMGFRSEGVKKA